MQNSKVSIAVTGASGFLGKHLLNFLSKRNDVEIRALIREKHENKDFIENEVTVIEGNLMRPETLKDFAVPGGTVVNLAYIPEGSQTQNLQAMDSLAKLCAEQKIRRLIHCSTAVVAGRVPDEIIDENTKCNPSNEYEKTKLAVEDLFVEKYGDLFEIIILRPTAVFGPGGKNLLKLAKDLSQGNNVLNYLKSCLFNHRRMNLVYVDNVISAIVFMIDMPRKMENEIFIVSDDEYPSNNYRDIEKCLMKRFGYNDYPLPRLPLPSFILAFLLKLQGKPDKNLYSVYDCEKIVNAGFRKPVLFDEGLDYFADWYKKVTTTPGK